ncbi:MAG: superoxide dismutase, partial [Candidatus Colwellbacteria bacterium]|nr:superoxide dismutase [Candidatus Colwellbacteria bacterium]
RKKIAETDKSEAGAVYSAIGEMKRQETFAVNGIKLHEIYFRLLGGSGEVSGTSKQFIERDFGSVENWRADYIATGMSARGWAILAYDLAKERLANYAMDAQNVGAVWAAVPLVAMDVYEHAYYMDHGTNRKVYIEAFLSQIRWEAANETLAKLK